MTHRTTLAGASTLALALLLAACGPAKDATGPEAPNTAATAAENRPPRIIAFDIDTPLELGGRSAEVGYQVSDPDGDRPLTCTIDFGDGTVQTRECREGPPGTIAELFSYRYAAVGRYTVTFTVRDPAGATASEGVAVLVVESRDVEVTLTAPDEVVAGSSFTVQSSIARGDPRGQPLNCVLAYPGFSGPMPCEGSQTITAPATPGRLELSLTAATSDFRTGGQSGQLVTVVPAPNPPANRPPSITMFSADAVITLGQTPAEIIWAVTDPDGDRPLTCSFDFGDGTVQTRDCQGGPPGTTIGGVFTRVYTAAGAYTVTLTVRDPAGATATATRTISVVDPVNPLNLSITGPAEVVAGSSFVVQTSASDPRGRQVNCGLEYTNFSGGIPCNGSQTITAPATPGPFTIALLGLTSDFGTSGRVEKVVQVVAPPNTPPQIVNLRADPAAGPYSISAKPCGNGRYTACVRFSVTDADGAADAPFKVVVDWGDNTAWAPNSVPASTPLVAPHDYTAPGTYTVKVTVTDQRGASTTSSLTLVVTP